MTAARSRFEFEPPLDTLNRCVLCLVSLGEFACDTTLPMVLCCRGQERSGGSGWACWAHNPKVRGTKPCSTTLHPHGLEPPRRSSRQSSTQDDFVINPSTCAVCTLCARSVCIASPSMPSPLSVRHSPHRTMKADKDFRAVPHPSTNRALCRLTSEVERDPAHSFDTVWPSAWVQV